jgi:hypothetical protein
MQVRALPLTPFIKASPLSAASVFTKKLVKVRQAFAHMKEACRAGKNRKPKVVMISNKGCPGSVESVSCRNWSQSALKVSNALRSGKSQQIFFKTGLKL